MNPARHPLYNYSMKNFVLILALGLMFYSCGTGDYPEIHYTNNLGTDIEFTTAEKNSPEHTVEAGKTITLSSDVPGRADIKSISERLAAWEYKDGNVYNIIFVPRKDYALDILNFAIVPVTISEKNGLLEKLHIEAEAAVSESVPGKASTKMYTTEPVFIFANASDITFKFRKNNDKYFLGINPPDGAWWGVE